MLTAKGMVLSLIAAFALYRMMTLEHELTVRTVSEGTSAFHSANGLYNFQQWKTGQDSSRVHINNDTAEP